MMPQLEKSIPRAVHVDLVSDRSLSIRASVSDVEFTLVLAMALVVLVIFLFLRKFWATVIPGIVLPVVIVATFGAMYLLGYSIDNLSLMALTIAIGFLVDDAIVMIENIVRHIEEGKPPLEAALDGAGEIGFTILSITLSLAAVFIPVLFMAGVVGLLFHEFAMTTILRDLHLRLRVADADADDVRAVPDARQRRTAEPLQPLARARLRHHARYLRSVAGRGPCGTSFGCCS